MRKPLWFVVLVAGLAAVGCGDKPTGVRADPVPPPEKPPGGRATLGSPGGKQTVGRIHPGDPPTRP